MIKLESRRELTRLSGRFFRIMLAEHADRVIDGPEQSRPGRFHGPGQRALYMSPSPEWASVGLAGATRDGRRRVVMELDVGWAEVIDLRNEENCRAATVRRQDADSPWRGPLAEEPPAPWRVADRVRDLGCDGLIDPSKLLAGAWHLVLFAWNGPGRPSVRVAGGPVPIPKRRDRVHLAPPAAARAASSRASFFRLGCCGGGSSTLAEAKKQ